MMQAGHCEASRLLEYGASSKHAVRRALCGLRLHLLANQLSPPPSTACSWAAGADAIVWAREYSMREHSKCDCDTLQQVLGEMPGAQRMVVSFWVGAPGLCVAPTGLSAAEVWQACGARCQREVPDGASI